MYRDDGARRLVRLTVIALAVSVALLHSVARLAAEAQPPPTVPRIGVLDAQALGSGPNAFRDGLRQFGYVEGKNLAIEWRGTAGAPNGSPTSPSSWYGSRSPSSSPPTTPRWRQLKTPRPSEHWPDLQPIAGKRLELDSSLASRPPLACSIARRRGTASASWPRSASWQGSRQGAPPIRSPGGASWCWCRPSARRS